MKVRSDASHIDKYLIRPNQNTVGGGGAGSKIFLCSVRARKRINRFLDPAPPPPTVWWLYTE